MAEAAVLQIIKDGTNGRMIQHALAMDPKLCRYCVNRVFKDKSGDGMINTTKESFQLLTRILTIVSKF